MTNDACEPDRLELAALTVDVAAVLREFAREPTKELDAAAGSAVDKAIRFVSAARSQGRFLSNPQTSQEANLSNGNLRPVSWAADALWGVSDENSDYSKLAEQLGDIEQILEATRTWRSAETPLDKHRLQNAIDFFRNVGVALRRELKRSLRSISHNQDL